METIMRSKLIPVFVMTLPLLVGCVAPHTRGVVAMKLTENEAHVCVGKEEVNVGDKLNVYRNDCTPKSKPIPKGSGTATQCEKKLVGQAEVTEVLNSHYSAVHYDGGQPIQEGDMVEKASQ